MYFTSLRFIFVGNGAVQTENTLRDSALLEDTEYLFESVHSVTDLPSTLGADTAIIVDSDISALRECAKLSAGHLILLASACAVSELSEEELALADDFWIMSGKKMYDEKMLKTHFRRLAKCMKDKADSRRLKICFETAIDSIPDLVWFKDVEGSHLIVNDSFCGAVEKTKQQIYKRGHYYIWDIPQEEYEQGEYVCLESEEIVMNAGKTCLFDEKVKTKSGMRQFKTYKSPLIDPDDGNGRIFGTCGLAHDVTDLSNINSELELVLESMPFAMLIEDRMGTILNINTLFEKYFGTEKVHLGCNYNEWKKTALKGKIHKFRGEEFILLDVDGEERVLRFEEKPIIDIFNEKIGSIGIFNDITLQKKYEEQTLHLANTDFLTQLNNRRSLFNYLNGIGKDTQIAMITIDLDRFKSVNDSFGHHVGDEALVLTAETLKECFPNDFVARLGGDEFLVAIVGSYADGELKERTTELLNKLIVRFSERSEFSMLSASAGIAVSENKSQDKHDIDNLMRRSDNALYEAKKTGRGKYCVY